MYSPLPVFLSSLNQLPVAAATDRGGAVVANSLTALDRLPDSCCELVFCSPPFDGPSEARFGGGFCVWLSQFFTHFDHVLKPDGSVVLELGQCWKDGAPTRTTHGFQFVSELSAAGRWHLLQEFYWYNPNFLKTPDAWLSNYRRFRDSVTTLYWFSRTPDAPLNMRGVRGRSGALLQPFGNLVAFDDGPEDLAYLDRCEKVGIQPHIDRFPVACPRFFIDLLTQPGNLVIDPFSGSAATGAAAEASDRRWLCIEQDPHLAASAAMRFL